MKPVEILDMPGKVLTVSDDVEYIVIVNKAPLILQDSVGHMYSTDIKAAKQFLRSNASQFHKFYLSEMDKHGIEEVKI